jgi:glycosyltransferase involved in cell wall biosynthesis
MMATPQLSVIVPTYQRRNSVARLLRALAHQTLAPDTYEVIISIDGSRDGTLELVETFSAPYRLAQVWQSNSGRAAARNAGIRLAQGEVLVFLDDDMEPAPDCLDSHWRAHSAGSRLVVIGAVPIRREEHDPPVADYIAAKFKQHLDRLAQPDHQFMLRDFYSGHFSIRRAVLFEIGLFDETFRIYGNEDLELSWRLRKAGVKLIYLPTAVAHQQYAKDFAALVHDTIAKGHTAILLASKHPESFAELQLNGYDRGSWRWRWARHLLLALSQWWPPLSEKISAFIIWLEQRKVKRMHLYYRFVLDYAYWLGARQALRENRHTDHGLTSLAGRHKA